MNVRQSYAYHTESKGTLEALIELRNQAEENRQRNL